MKSKLAIVLMAVALAGLGTAAQQGGALEQDLMKLERLWNNVPPDRATLEQLLADDFSYTHSTGVMSNKTQEIADTLSSQWTSSKTDDMKVRVFGDVAIVTGRQTLEGTSKGYKGGPRRFTDIFVKRNGKWLVVAGQTTLVQAK